jgi:3-oxoacyl-[acyl-carrier-protein] synthase II
MAASSRRAVVTGLGVISPLGDDLASFWDALRQGKSGIRPIKAFDTSALPVRFAGEIPDFDANRYVEKKDRKSLRVMARTIKLAIAGAQRALEDSGVNKEKLDPTRFGVEFGSGLIASELEELGEASLVSTNCQPGSVDLLKWGEAGIPKITPLWMLKYLPNMLASHVSILHNAQGPNNTITANDVAGLQALGEAYRILDREQADFMLVGGAESKINPLSLVRQCLFEALSRRNDAPERACRPFDRQRDGIVLGEGSAVLVLEELEHARRRDARIYGEVVGFAAGFEQQVPSKGANHRSGATLARVLRNALTEAGIGPEDVDHVNAHGLSTAESDTWEARALQDVFGQCRPPVPVLAAKSYLGNLGAGASTVELAASLLGLKHGLVPATLNYEESDPDCPVSVITGTPKPATRPYVLKVSCTLLGQCAALVYRRWD